MNAMIKIKLVAKNAAFKIGLVWKILFEFKRFFIIIVEKEIIANIYLRESFNYNLINYDIPPAYVDYIINEIHYSRDDIDRVLELAIFEAEIETLIKTKIDEL